jgi:hypothetical protein
MAHRTRLSPKAEKKSICIICLPDFRSTELVRDKRSIAVEQTVVMGLLS